jgi:cytochrome bd-type quinol oxidase subunit 2
MIRLYGVEVQRLLARRAFRVLLLLLLVGTATVMVIIAVHSNRDLAAAHAKAAALARQVAGRKIICVQQPGGSAPCPRPTAADFYSDPRWSFAGNGASLVGGAVLAVGLLGLLVGASVIGAEWTAGTFTALLSWEPRRLRVLTAKVAAAVSVMIAVGAVAVAVNIGAGWLIADTRGNLAHATSGLLTSLVLRGLRGLVIIGLLTALGTAIAGLTRHTAAALGAAVGYLVGFELVLQHLHPQWNRWLLTSNAIAFLNDRNQAVFERDGFFVKHPFVLSAHRGLTFLAVVVAVIVAAHAVALVRRDAI